MDEELGEVLIDEELPTLVRHPERTPRYGVLRIGEMHVGDDERVQLGFHLADSIVSGLGAGLQQANGSALEPFGYLLSCPGRRRAACAR